MTFLIGIVIGFVLVKILEALHKSNEQMDTLINHLYDKDMHLEGTPWHPTALEDYLEEHQED